MITKFSRQRWTRLLLGLAAGLMVLGWLVFPLENPAGGWAAALPTAEAYLPLIRHLFPSPQPTSTPALPLSPLLISELLFDSSGFEPEEEWVELVNTSRADLSLKGYKIGDAWKRGDREGMYYFPKEAVLRPGQVIVVAVDAEAFSSMYGFPPNYELVNTDPDVPDLDEYKTWPTVAWSLLTAVTKPWCSMR